MALGGESYLNFMGNEFGHPEWIDFPRDDTYDPSTGAFVPGTAVLVKTDRAFDLVRQTAMPAMAAGDTHVWGGLAPWRHWGAMLCIQEYR
jgi:hypothetical protein